MSSIFKGIKKIFKKVVEVVKKVAPIVVGIGALVFTAGSALGVTAMQGGWAGAAATVGNAIGGSGVIGTALGGAIQQAGVGALIGGTAAAAGGGSFTEGMKQGAKVGAITGGLLSGYGAIKNGISPAGGVTTHALPPAQAPGAGVNIDIAGNPIAAPGAGASSVAGAGATAGGRVGLLSGVGRAVGGVGKFVKDNQLLVGSAMQGIGASLDAKADFDDRRGLLTKEYDLRSRNYAGADPSSAYRSAAPGSSPNTPSQRFSGSYYGGWEYQYNPTTGRIERVPTSNG